MSPELASKVWGTGLLVEWIALVFLVASVVGFSLLELCLPLRGRWLRYLLSTVALGGCLGSSYAFLGGLPDPDLVKEPPLSWNLGFCVMLQIVLLLLAVVLVAVLMLADHLLVLVRWRIQARRRE